MQGLTVGAAAARTGWSARMLRYLEARGLVVPERSASGYRLYGLGQLNRLMGLTQLRTAHGVGIDEIAFAARLRREPELRREVDAWLAAGDDAGSWIDWEQRKHQRLLAA